MRLILDLTRTLKDENIAIEAILLFSGLFQDKSLFLKTSRIFFRTKQNSRTFPGFPGFLGRV